jgi:hypothetical protein
VLGAWRQATETEAFGQEEAVLAADDVRSPARAVSGTSLEEADIAIAENLGRRRNDPSVRAVGALSEIADQPPALALCAAVSAGWLVPARLNLQVLAPSPQWWPQPPLRTLSSVVARTRPHVLLTQGRYEVKPGGPDDGD